MEARQNAGRGARHSHSVPFTFSDAGPAPATVNGEQITYTHLVPTANMQIDETMTFARGISDGSVKIRFYCEANATGGTEPNGGTIRWASSADNGYNDSPVIQVVE